jgi:predicted amidohydrolase
MNTKFRIAGVQTDVRLGEVDNNLERMLAWLQDERVKKADLVVFPECALSGYCFDSLEEAGPNAQAVPGPASDAIANACRENGKHVAFGMLEKGQGPEIFNTCVLVGPTGVVGAYRKAHLPFLGVDRFTTPGNPTYAVEHVGDLRLGMQICYDGIFPEPCRALALNGADLIILPTNWPPGADTFAKFIPNSRALENNVYFMSVNRIGIERGFRFIGQSKFCDTNGNTVVEAGESDECVIIGEVDTARAREKRLVRVPGKHIIDRWNDRRPELYGRIVAPKSAT